MGKTGYYHRFIKNYAVIAAPLFEKVGKCTAEEEREVFELTVPMQQAFQQLKQHLLTAPVLAFPQLTRPSHSSWTPTGHSTTTQLGESCLSCKKGKNG